MAQQDVNPFCGIWNVRRKIFDQRTSSYSHFEGQACITPTQFDEHGDTFANGAKLRSRRTYSLVTERNRVTVRFPGMREFVCIDDAASQQLAHHCGDDFYKGRVVFLSTNGRVEVWRVFGPRKDYRSIAFYRRA